jgi:hypothetical protein
MALGHLLLDHRKQPVFPVMVFRAAAKCCHS